MVSGKQGTQLEIQWFEDRTREVLALIESKKHREIDMTLTDDTQLCRAIHVLSEWIGILG